MNSHPTGHDRTACAVAVGVGCQRGVSLETLAACVDAALGRLGGPRVHVLASAEHKRDEAALKALASQRGWPLRLYRAEALAGIPVATPSATVQTRAGSASVAEAAAMLAAGTGLDGLLLAKQSHRGADGKHATVAIARLP